MPFARILVAVDGSPNSQRAADSAIDLAKKEGASLFVLNVIPSPVIVETTMQGASAPGGEIKAFIDKARQDAEGYLQSAVANAQGAGLKVRGEIVENVPSVVEAIMDYADEWKIDLIVVGTRGLSGFKKLLLGSVSSALISHASCSVLIVR